MFDIRLTEGNVKSFFRNHEVPHRRIMTFGMHRRHSLVCLVSQHSGLFGLTPGFPIKKNKSKDIKVEIKIKKLKKLS